MVVNRYTQLPQNAYTYNPRSLQELMIAPAYMREQHNALEENIAATETALAQIDNLDVHNSVVQAEQERLYNQLQQQADMLNKEGFNSSNKSAFLRFNKDYQNSIGPKGILGQAQNAKQVLEANKAAYIANATKLGYSADAIAANWADEEAKYREEFNRTGKITNINERFSPNYRNVTDELTKLLTNAGLTATDISNLGSDIITTDPRGQYVLTKGAQEAYSSNINQLQAAVDYINNQVMNPNSEIGQSLKEQRKTPEQALQETIGLADVFVKNSTKTSDTSQISGFKSAAELGISAIPENLNYESKEAEIIKNKQTNYSNKLSNILSGKKIPMNTFGKDNPRRASGFQKGNDYQTATFNNSFTDPQEIKEYNDLFTRLQKVNTSLQNIEPTSLEAMQAVKTYLDNNQNILRQNIVITDDVMTSYGDNSIGTNKTNAKKVMEGIRSSASDRKYSINGKIYTYDQLPDDIKQAFGENSSKLVYQGYYSPKNFMTDQYGEFKDRNLFVSPLSVNYFDDKGNVQNIMISRSSGEMAKPSYKADQYFNDIFVNTNKNPGLPYNMPGQQSEITYFPNGVPIPSATPEDKYLINKQDENGSYSIPTFVTEEELQNMIYSGFNVITPSEIKANNKKANK